MTILTYYEYLLEHKLSHSKETYREYRKYYHRLYQRQRRKDNKEVVVLLSPDEHTTLKAKAIEHKQSLSRFILSSSLAYNNQKFITPDGYTVSRILQTLSSTYSQIEYVADQITGTNQVKLIQHLCHLIDRLETNLEKLLVHPDSLEKLTRKTLRSHPHYYQVLTDLLKTYDH